VALSPGLHALSIEPDEAMREYAHIRLKLKAISDRLVRNPIIDQFSQAAPGFRELLVLGKLWWLAEQKNGRGDPRFEAIVVDAPATGHGLSFLGMAGVIAKAFPVGPIASEATSVDGFVRNPDRVGAVLVALPEEIPINETLELHQQLGEQGVAISSLVVNAVIPQRFSAEEQTRIRAWVEPNHDPQGVSSDQARPVPSAELRPVLTAALRELMRAAEQSSELDRLTSQLDTPVRCLPFVPHADLDPDDIDHAATLLTGPKGKPIKTGRPERKSRT
jgi:anion-transporting  ArsA/GET3 family ATPase